MPIILYFYAIGILIAGALNTLFGFSVYIKNRKNISGVTYALLSVAFAVWCYSWFVMLLVNNNEQLALFFARLLNFGAVFIPAFYFHWITSILGIEKENRKNIWSCYILILFFAILSWTSYYVSGVHSVLFFTYWPTAGFLYIFYLIFGYFTFPAYGIYLLFKNLRGIDKNDKIKKNQIRYVLLGTLMGFGGGVLNFFLMYSINPFGPFFEAGLFAVLLAFVPFAVPLAYATMKYQLMDMKFVLTEIVAGLVSTTLLIDSVFSIFTSANSLVILFKISVFLIFSYFGIILIRSVLREVKQKEKMEEMAKDLARALEAEKKAHEIEKKAMEQMKELGTVKDQFLMTIQHHLRTPLTSMIGYSDLLLQGLFGKVPPKIEEVIVKMKTSTASLIKMVNDFLDITQFQLGKEVVSLKPAVDIQLILNEIINELKFQAESKKIYLKFEKPEKISLIKADPEKLKAALYNIIDNAVKYTTKGGITVKVEESAVLKIIVSDTGIGISSEHVKNLFNRLFERGQDAKKIFTTGRGIGLYLSSQIIKYHNGKIWAESEGEGKGSQFFIELPINNN